MMITVDDHLRKRKGDSDQMVVWKLDVLCQGNAVKKTKVNENKINHTIST